MNARLHADALATEATVPLTLDGQPVLARPGETIWQLAQRMGQTIPHLCHSDGLRPDGNCRACVVEVAGERTLSASCCRVASAGLDVNTQSERAVKSRALVLELLLADTAHAQPAPEALPLPATPALGELSAWAEREGVALRPALQASALPATRPAQPTDNSHPAMVVNLDACIQCTRCVRACRESQVNDVIGLAGRGSDARIVFDLGDPMGESSCVACGECVQACPTGALALRNLAPHSDSSAPVKEVDSVCPFCGVGCQITYQVRTDASAPQGERIVAVQGKDGPANAERLCVKGRFGFDYVHHPDRLLRPLIRRDGVAKDPQHLLNPPDWRSVFREATWDEALALAAGGFKALRERHGPHSLAGFGSAKGSNEEAYLFQNWCAPPLAPTTSTTAPACATRPAWPPCWKAWAQVRSATRWPTWPTPT